MLLSLSLLLMLLLLLGVLLLLLAVMGLLLLLLLCCTKLVFVCTRLYGRYCVCAFFTLPFCSSLQLSSPLKLSKQGNVKDDPDGGVFPADAQIGPDIENGSVSSAASLPPPPPAAGETAISNQENQEKLVEMWIFSPAVDKNPPKGFFKKMLSSSSQKDPLHPPPPPGDLPGGHLPPLGLLHPREGAPPGGRVPLRRRRRLLGSPPRRQGQLQADGRHGGHVLQARVLRKEAQGSPESVAM